MRRQFPCDTCARQGKVQVANYRCPACARCSCSLACVKSHKAYYNCTGIRDRTAPVPKRSYDEHTFVSDYALLEEAKRQKENAKRNRINNKFIHPTNNRTFFDPIPRYKQRIMGQEAAKRGIDLRFMPSVFYRHKNNTSHVKPVDYSRQQQRDNAYRPFDKLMVWRVDIHFCGPDGGTRLVHIHHLDEEANMADVLERAIQTLEIRKEPRLNGDTDQYLLYAGMPGSKLSAYIRNDTELGRREAEPSVLPRRPSHKRRRLNNAPVHPTPLHLDTRGFIPVHTDKTLRESLCGALVVEYPILFVAPKGSPDDHHLRNATKNLFTKPEPEVDDTSPRPHFKSIANRTTYDTVRHAKHRVISASHSQTNRAGSTHKGAQEDALPIPRAASSVVQNESAAVNPRTDPELPIAANVVNSEPQKLVQKRKAEESADSEAFRSELEPNGTGYLTQRKTKGGKTGYTCDGKLRVSKSPKPSQLPLTTSALTNPLSQGDHGNGHNKVEQDADDIRDGEEADDPGAEESAQSESENDQDSAEVDDGSANDSPRGGEDDEDVDDDEDEQDENEEETGQTLRLEVPDEVDEVRKESEDDETNVCKGFYRRVTPLLGTI